MCAAAATLIGRSANREREQRPVAGVQLEDVEAHRLERGSQRSARERADVRREWMLDTAEEHAPARRRRRRQREPPARAQHAADLGKRELDVANVLERLDAG